MRLLNNSFTTQLKMSLFTRLVLAGFQTFEFTEQTRFYPCSVIITFIMIIILILTHHHPYTPAPSSVFIIITTNISIIATEVSIVGIA